MDLQRLADLYEIQRLKARYFRLLDLKQWDALRDLLTDNFELFVDTAPAALAEKPSFVGADALVRHLSGYSPLRTTVHHAHMPEIEFVDADRATGIWAMSDSVDDPARGDVHRGFGHCHERYLRCPDGRWRIASTRLTRIRVDYVPSRR